MSTPKAGNSEKISAAEVANKTGNVAPASAVSTMDWDKTDGETSERGEIETCGASNVKKNITESPVGTVFGPFAHKTVLFAQSVGSGNDEKKVDVFVSLLGGDPKQVKRMPITSVFLQKAKDLNLQPGDIYYVKYCGTQKKQSGKGAGRVDIVLHDIKVTKRAGE